jgi:ABC-type multidrug transport system ATPase subunit
MHTPLIELRALDRRFGPRAALSAVDLVVGPGEIHGLIGPRGAGKTSLLRVLAGELAPSSGLVWVPSSSAFVTADAAGDRRIALARALAGAPDVLLIDEPAGGVDGETSAATRALIGRHAAGGGAVVWATRRLDHLQQLASGVTLLAAGRVRYTGSVETLAARALAGSMAPLAAAA